MAKKRIRYESLGEGVYSVSLDGQKRGDIRKKKSQWFYYEGGLIRNEGEPFKSLKKCKESLETEL